MAESEIAALKAGLCDALSERRHWKDEFLKLSTAKTRKESQSVWEIV